MPNRLQEPHLPTDLSDRITNLESPSRGIDRVLLVVPRVVRRQPDSRSVRRGHRRRSMADLFHSRHTTSGRLAITDWASADLHHVCSSDSQRCRHSPARVDTLATAVPPISISLTIAKLASGETVDDGITRSLVRIRSKHTKNTAPTSG